MRDQHLFGIHKNRSSGTNCKYLIMTMKYSQILVGSTYTLEFLYFIPVLIH